MIFNIKIAILVNVLVKPYKTTFKILTNMVISGTYIG